MSVLISASLLSADLSCLKQEIDQLEQAGIDRIHIDIMDNHYVPNLTFGPVLVKAIRQHTKLPFEVHLMVKNVDSIIPAVIDAGADIVLVHPDTTHHLHRTLSLVKSLNTKAGIALNPTTGLECLTFTKDIIDQVLVMTVNPGFGGQAFIDSQLKKIKDLYSMVAGTAIEIAVDGGINHQTAIQCRANGATVLIAGQSIFKTPNYRSNIDCLRAESVSTPPCY